MSATKTSDPVVIRPQPGPQEAFLASSADITIYGGAAGGGKTYGLLLEAARHSGNSDFGAVIFRRTYPQIMNEGGLWDESNKLYPYLNADPVTGNLNWRFPSGATVSFRHLQHERNVLDWQGAQIPLIGFDELTHFSAYQFWYMLSRNRSMSGVRPYVRATTNPDADSWVADLIAWWIDQETGLPIKERAGVLRWFVRVGDDIVWANDPAELEAKHPDIPPKSLTFVPAKLEDNVALMEADPQYRANLLALARVERERLLGGNWKIRAEAGEYFRRSYFNVVRASPAGGSVVRAWDLAATEKERGKDDPDWTVGLRVRRTTEGRFVVEHMERMRSSPGKVRAAIKNVADQDGRGVRIRIPQDPGQAGKAQVQELVSMLAGHRVRALPVTGDKTVRAGPASSQAEAGNIDIVEGPWNEAFLSELENFPSGAHDDIVDALSDAVDELTRPVGRLDPIPSHSYVTG